MRLGVWLGSLALGLVVLVLYYFVVGDIALLTQTTMKRPIEIEPIVAEHQSIDLTIEKREKGEMVAILGNLESENTLTTIVSLLINEKVYHEVTINPLLVDDEEVLVLLYKILPLFSQEYQRWLIRYKDHKLLLDGETDSKESLEKIRRLLAYSSINSFNNTFLKEHATKKVARVVLEELAEVTQEDNPSRLMEDNLSEDDLDAILSDLKLALPTSVLESSSMKQKKRLKPYGFKPLHGAKSSKIQKKKKHKKVVEVKSRRKLAPQVRKKHSSSAIKAKRVEEVELNIMMLPMVKPVPMDIEEKIQLGLIPPPRTKKPLVRYRTQVEGSSYDSLPLNDSIPWARLHDVDEKLDGIVLEEVVASPSMIRRE